MLPFWFVKLSKRQDVCLQAPPVPWPTCIPLLSGAACFPNWASGTWRWSLYSWIILFSALSYKRFTLASPLSRWHCCFTFEISIMTVKSESCTQIRGFPFLMAPAPVSSLGGGRITSSNSTSSSHRCRCTRNKSCRCRHFLEAFEVAGRSVAGAITLFVGDCFICLQCSWCSVLTKITWWRVTCLRNTVEFSCHVCTDWYLYFIIITITSIRSHQHSH